MIVNASVAGFLYSTDEVEFYNTYIKDTIFKGFRRGGILLEAASQIQQLS